MSTIKAIIIGIFIWILGVSIYTVSYFIPFMENMELQANLVLATALIPCAWLGAKVYYMKGVNMHGLKLGAIVVLTAILLDALVTMPYLILPNGGSYQNFFGVPAFWLIVTEYFLIVFAYWYFRVRNKFNQLV